MQDAELKKLFGELRALPGENEWVDFKEAKNGFNFDKLGKYFSALSNEANLKDKQWGWLIFGVTDKTRKIVGTNYKPNRIGLDNLKHEVARQTTNNITFVEIHELIFSEGRVLMFQIPAAPPGIPIAWQGHYYGRDGESLVALNIQELEEIRSQIKADWSAEICEGAGTNDLDSDALKKAREEYKKKQPGFANEVNRWDDLTFLNKAKVIIQGNITRAAIVLLGKPESEHFIAPGIAKITWVLKDEHGVDKDYEHFGPPFILNTNRILAKIRNLKYRYLPNETLFPVEINQYDPYVIREALHNCIAHQNYELKERINVIEKPEELIFNNGGSFIPKTIEAVIEQNAPPKYYRNQFLTTAMANLNMIDTIGGGIRKMFTVQKDRFFPLPSYDLSKPNEVTVKIAGKVLNENYTQLLIENPNVDIRIVMLLDKVQKREKINKEEANLLKKQKLIEGRHPNIFITSRVAVSAADKAKYIKYRGFNNAHYKKMIIDFIKEYSSASKKEINDLLMDKISDALSERQKQSKINNLLFSMSSRDKTIRNDGSKKKSKWVLAE
ncbi:transcriptional regulator [Candidatus Desantisbacteria bacterium CG_4_10_14_0_8_um_filter_48_22]|uniref:Transcriptional regulator n=1 Tax=Candidatus Desantisbacteria bacterium CG_4_10_14_0_8_um_filter_48_22 TaxID=1974543 RepID=A0A2M7S4C7_9BACT|nr:MAG: transcriptional regulator [Candidatus Desantisbacteria bacterium CG1_02_49_89]PIV54182.1 MAG: transcriptional regulator [Candidatus Desantisbacteria bacterium CG02_land_8_20_14_3_00_49_13]PIZ14402.1 MAG: transcriptional regulator [Candidatus Desantisbacteria bacterium CG_4_10_14_0_8_um_filter_48_22]PJB27284.1 MAG: transcriptional regulator [Candidatus Desantisbacteria bacterium CG_4_9_14_3_um_filter_50_7]